MITVRKLDDDGNHYTARGTSKQRAMEELRYLLSDMEYHISEGIASDPDGMTDKEQEAVLDASRKLCDRMYKIISNGTART